MKRKMILAFAIAFILSLCLPFHPAPVVAAGDWTENWDAYPVGQDMHGMNGWTGWDNNPGATAYTSAAQAVSAPHSIEIAGASDLVYAFSGYDDGVWRFTTRQYIPTGFTGTTYLILLNQYGGPYDWSTQVEFIGAGNVVHDDNTGSERPLVRDRWVEIRIEIDLDADLQRFYYDGFLLSEGAWTHGTGITSIGALDLYANGSSAVYYDDLSLAVPVAEDWSEDWDDYTTGQDMHGVNGWTGWDNNPGATAYTSASQAVSAPHSIEVAGATDLVQTFDGYDEGLWRFSAQQYVPAGFTGTTYLILLNQYGGPYDWSTQVEFMSASNVVHDDYTGTERPLVRDRWVEIRIEIDLDADWQRLYYDGFLLSEGSWTHGTGITSIGALDLYANGSSAVYYDDLSLAVPAAEDWSEDWDDYATGQDMHGVNGWTGWDNNPGATAFTSTAQSKSAPRSVEIAGAADLVQTFVGYDDGLWRFTAWQYVPAGFTGTTYLILMDQYGDTDSWATQIEFRGDEELVVDDFASTWLPLVRDRWVEIRIEIDLDADWQRVIYDGTLMSEIPWTSYGGITSFGALDLYANNSSAVFYDDLSLTRIVNHAPLAVDDAVSTPEDTPVNIDVLANDTDADGDLLTVSAVTAPLHGSAVIQPDQTVTYTPDPDWSGATDSFIYFIADEAGAASAADVYVTVTAVNDPPVAAPDAYTAAENTLLTVPASGVLGNDTDTEGDPLTAVLTEDALHGTLTLSPDGSFTYLPDADWWGTDVFSYNAHDGGLDSAPVDVTITVMPRSLLTNGGLAAFDMDGTTEGSQFRLIFTPDAAAPRTFRLNASNPGQFSYNLYWPEGGEVDVVIPYPFVTQGAAPVQFYDGAELLETDGGWSLIPGGWVASDAQTVSLDPDGEDSVLTLTFPEGAVFATIHLDYGLKGTQPYEAGGVDHLDAIGETETVRNLSDYGFTADDGTIDDEAVIQNINVFKKIAGIGGLATEGGAPLADVGIVITSPVLPSPVTVRTDADGWYLWNWKHTGKAAEFTVTMQYGTEPFPSQTVTLKSGKYAQADFILP